jgi:hypothetical protein
VIKRRKRGSSFLERIIALPERHMLRRSKGEQIDGLWIGAFDDNPEPILHRLREALQLIEAYDPSRYSRLRRDLERVWVCGRAPYRGSYNSRLDACELDKEFVLAEAPELLASVIMHEATHARLRGCGIGNEEWIRPRIEAICVRRELAFTAKLPNGQRAHEWARQKLAWCKAENLSDAARAKWDDDWYPEEFRRLGAPHWIVCAIFAFVCLARTAIGNPLSKIR